LIAGIGREELLITVIAWDDCAVSGGETMKTNPKKRNGKVVFATHSKIVCSLE
jgi:hypothetical protein